MLITIKEGETLIISHDERDDICIILKPTKRDIEIERIETKKEANK